MVKLFNDKEIFEHLKMLSDWLRVKYPGDHFDMVVVGGAAMALEGFKDQTVDIDVLFPEVLPEPIASGVTHISRIKRLGPGWLNSDVANMLSMTKISKSLPAYFNEISRSFEVGENLKISLIGRQALISLKMYAATPSYSKHTDDIQSLAPTVEEITKAVSFVLSIDSTEIRKDDLRIVLTELGFDFDEILVGIERRGKQGP